MIKIEMNKGDGTIEMRGSNGELATEIGIMLDEISEQLPDEFWDAILGIHLKHLIARVKGNE